MVDGLFVEVSGDDLAGSMHVTVKLSCTKRWLLRVRIAGLLLKLAKWVCPVPMEVEVCRVETINEADPHD